MTGSTPGDGGPDETVGPTDELAVVYRPRFGTGSVSGTPGVDDVDGSDAGGGGSVATVESTDDEAADGPDGAREDWAWVREWRAGQEPTPWVTGIPLAVFSALVVGVAVWVLSAGLADRPIVAVLVNLLVAGGLTPAMWLSRNLPVLRWIAAGAAAGIVLGWIGAILMLPVAPV